jgi:hypothetical protein
MAKSLRSKTKRKYRTLKREQVFAPVEEERLLRLAEAQAQIKSTVDDQSNVTPVQEKREMPLSDTPLASINETAKDESMMVDSVPSSKLEKDKLFLSRNQFKKKMRIQRKKTLGKRSKK